jgi:hypothetical protein
MIAAANGPLPHFCGRVICAATRVEELARPRVETVEVKQKRQLLVRQQERLADQLAVRDRAPLLDPIRHLIAQVGNSPGS